MSSLVILQECTERQEFESDSHSVACEEKESKSCTNYFVNFSEIKSRIMLLLYTFSFWLFLLFSIYKSSKQFPF